MRIATRSNALGVLSGASCVALAVWSRYEDWWWYDNLAHLLGGVSLASLVADEDSPLGQDLAIVGCLTLAWEIFEYGKQVHPWGGDRALPDEAAAEDTVLDTLLVALGAYNAAKWAKGGE